MTAAFYTKRALKPTVGWAPPTNTGAPIVSTGYRLYMRLPCIESRFAIQDERSGSGTEWDEDSVVRFLVR